MTLRRLLSVAACLYCMAGLAALSRAAIPFPAPRQVAPGVYVMPGVMQEAAPGNRGIVANTGFLVGESGVIVIDTGTSEAHARRLLAAIASVTVRPVLLAINTHAAPAHIFGNGLFVRRQVPVLAHRDTDATIARRCQTCLDRLRAVLGAAQMRGTAVVRPTQLVDAGERLRVGGRVFDLLYFGATESPGAIAVHDVASGVLFTGAIASIGRIPALRDGDTGRWIEALARLQALGATLVVPAHGPVSKPARLAETARYLGLLAERVEKNRRAGAALAETVRSSEVAEFAHWALYGELHRRNVHFQYLAAEQRSLRDDADPDAGL